LGNNLENLGKVAGEMNERGLLARDIEDALIKDIRDIVLNRAAASNATEILYREFDHFQNRFLSIYKIEYLFLDTLYERLNAIK
jgi:hypothetical protein